MNRDATRVNRYDWILFDADETLFHFDALAGLQLMFSRFGIDFSASLPRIPNDQKTCG
jgi:5'-nucleotidase